jgi:hypothetical protein
MRKRCAGTSIKPGLLILLVTCALSHAGLARAFGQQGAAIVGTVTDESGAALPGVTVTATSPALQVQSVVAITDERGEYRVAPLPIGVYTIDYVISGFASVHRDGLRLTVGFTATLDVAMKVGAIEESVTVSGVAPVVDVTSGTTATTFTRETLEVSPTSRNGLIGLMAQAPGVRTNIDVGGSSITDVPTSRLFGQSGEPWTILEGVPTTALIDGGGNGNYWDYVTIEEASVKTIGNDAEHPNRGVSITAVVKSGSNQFHGGAFYGRMAPNLQSSNITPTLRAQGIGQPPRLVERYDTNADLGGRIVQDKLWFYTSARRRVDVSEGTGAFREDGSPSTSDDLSWFTTQKISWQATPLQRVIGFHTYNHKFSQPAGSRLTDYRSTSALRTLPRITKVEWQWIKGSSLVMAAQFGKSGYVSNYHNRAKDTIARMDLATNVVTGPATISGRRALMNRDDLRASVGWYRPDLLWGSHQMKFGVGFDNNSLARAHPLNEDTPINTQLLTRNGTAVEMRAFNVPTFPDAHSHYLEIYAKDEWRVFSRVTVNIGARFAADRGFVPESNRQAALPPAQFAYPAQAFPEVEFNTFRSLAPRIHAIYDVTGNGRTVIKGGWGRFAKMRMLTPDVAAVDANAWGYAAYRWSDPNGNNLYDAGEVDLNPNGPDFLTQVTNDFIVNPEEKMPWAEEWNLSVEREVMPGFGVRVTGVYARNWNVYRSENIFRPYEAYSIPITNIDPGGDGIVGSLDDPGRSLTYYEYPTSLQGQRFDKNRLSNDSSVNQNFKSLEFGGFKRMSDGWQIMASYSATKKHIPLTAGLTQSGVNSNIYAGALNPNTEINTFDNTWERTAKVSGAYGRLPGGITLAVNYEFRSGTPLARTVVLRGGRTIPNLVVNAEPIGSLWTPNYHLADLRVEKSIRLNGRHRATVRANIFNVLNNSTALQIQSRSGPDFGYATSIVQPRIAEFTFAYSF